MSRPGKYRRKHVQELHLPNRLRKACVNDVALRAAQLATAPDGGQHDDYGVRNRGIRPNCGNDGRRVRGPVSTRRLGIQDREMKWVSTFVCRPNRPQSINTRIISCAADSPSRHLLVQYPANRFAAAGDHYTRSLELRGRSRCDRRLPIDPQRQSEPERRAFALSALDAYAASHKVDELLGNRQPQARPSVFPRCGAIHLAEFFEQESDLVRGNADTGVADRNAPAGGALLL